MSENTKLNGIEKFFVKYWESWDEIDCFIFQFYDVVFTEEFSKVIGAETAGNLTIDCSNCLVQSLSNDGEILFEKKFKISLD